MANARSMLFVLLVAGLSACGDQAAGPDATTQLDASPLPADGADAATGAPLQPWSKTFGEASAGEIEGVKASAVDSKGNIVIVGDLWGAANFGGGVLTTAGEQDGFIAKLDAAGTHRWSLRFGDVQSYQVATAVAVDASDNIYVAGEFEGSITFGATTLVSAGEADAFVVKFASDGSVQWARAFGDAKPQRVRSIAVDSNANVILAGEFAGNLTLGASTLTATGGADAFLTACNSNGEPQWARRFGGDGKTSFASIAVDTNDDIVAVGEFNLTVDFGGGALTSAGGSDIVVAKYAPTGTHTWSRRFGGTPRRQTAEAVALDGEHHIGVVTTFEGTVNLGGSDLVDTGFPTLGASNIGVVKLNAAGEHVFSAGFGDAARQLAKTLTFDDAGNLFVIGQGTGEIGFGATTLTTTANSLLIARLDKSGAATYARAFGDVGETSSASRVYVVGPDTLLVTGRHSGKVTFGQAVFETAAGDYDAFVARLKL